MHNLLPSFEHNSQRVIDVYFDNKIFNPVNYSISRKEYNSKIQIELNLMDFEFSYFSKYVDNIEIIGILNQIKKQKLRGKKKKKELLKTVNFFNCGFKKINEIRQAKIINFLNNPYQTFTVNGDKVKIINFERILSLIRLPEYRIIGEFNNGQV